MYAMNAARQETISVDQVVDRLLRRGLEPVAIADAVNAVFLCQRITADDVAARERKIEAYRARLAELPPGIAQRTPEWYEARKGIVTASDFAQALGDAKFGTQRQFFIKKCGWSGDTDATAYNPSAPPLKWGVMFEPVACMLYEARQATKVREFGLLLHPTVPWFGASPDGINDQGVMVEIKCPFRRQITGQVPLQYYYQIQGQLDVCGLDECDYLECEFVEYADVDAFLDAPDGKETGLVVEARAPEGAAVPYEFVHYSGVCSTRGQRTAAVEAADVAAAGRDGIVLHAWRIETFNVVRVQRDPAFIDEKMRALGDVWDRVLRYRGDRDAYVAEVTGSAAKRKASAAVSLDAAPGVYAFLEDDG